MCVDYLGLIDKCHPVQKKDDSSMKELKKKNPNLGGREAPL